jgi:hypothetical protein
MFPLSDPALQKICWTSRSGWACRSNLCALKSCIGTLKSDPLGQRYGRFDPDREVHGRAWCCFVFGKGALERRWKWIRLATFSKRSPRAESRRHPRLEDTNSARTTADHGSNQVNAVLTYYDVGNSTKADSML